MKKALLIIVLAFFLVSWALASDTKVSPNRGATIPNPDPVNDIWFVGTGWTLPTSGEWYGIGCKWDAGTLKLWCGDWSNYAAFEFGDDGTPTGVSFDLDSLCDPNDHAYVADDSDIGASDSLFIGDYATFGTNLVDIWDNIATSPTHRDWNVTATTVMGIAYSPEFDVLYYTDDYSTLVWGDLNSTTFSQVGTSSTDSVGGLAFVPAEAKAHPPLLIMISQTLWITILELDGTTGYPTGSIWSGWDQIAMPSGIEMPGGCEWDGQFLWIVDQETSSDVVMTLGLEGLSPNVGIQPTSLGNIKAMFK